MTTQVRVLEDVPPMLLVGLIEAEGIDLAAGGDALTEWIAEQVARCAAGDVPTDDVKAASRRLLRQPRYKPSGRGKPASEYLVGAAQRGEFPRINAVVDIFNGLSLVSGLPISLLDRDAACEQSTTLDVRLGRAGESYVFNTAGHEISLEDLLLVAREGDRALGNPVKDSMATKTSETTSAVLALVWASSEAIERSALEEFLRGAAGLLTEHAGAASVETSVVSRSLDP